MNDEWVGYVDSLELTAAARSSLEEAWSVARLICPEGLLSLFVSETAGEDGRRVLEDAWFFSESYACESESFVGADNCDLLVIRESITYVDARWRSYDFKEATDASRLFVRFDTSDGSESRLTASGSNCDALREVFLKHVKPNLWSR